MQASSPTPRHPSKAATQGSYDPGSKSQGNQNIAAKSPSLIDVSKHPAALSDSHKEPAAESEESSIKLTSLPPVVLADKHKSLWDYFFAWGPWVFGLITCIAAAFQVLLLFRTWETIGRQAKMQQAGLSQWVDIQPIGVLVSTKSKADPPDKVALTLRWNLLNNTALPFTVQRVEIHVLKAATEEISVVEEVEVIPPAKDGSRNFYPFFIETDLTKRETKEFLEKGILLTVQIEISYIDATGEEKDRFFGDHYHCEKNTLTFSGDFMGKTPQKRIEKDDSPSTMRARTMHMVQWEEDSDPPKDTPNPN